MSTDSSVPSPLDAVQAKRGAAGVMARLFGGDATVQLGRYVVLQSIGSGGMGVVYRAYDPQLRREVALKLVRPGSRSQGQRIVHEAQALAQLSHPNVVAVHDVGVDGEHTFVAMELLEGQTLAEWGSTPRRWQDVVAVYLQVARGLSAAHAVGLVHRDIKPSNLMRCTDGRVRVLDFGLAEGIAEAFDGGEATAPSGEIAAGDSVGGSAAAGATAGTPAYMAPEQHHGQAATAQSDQYSFCVALYEALFGMRPFVGDTVETLARAKARRPTPPSPSARSVPARLVRVVLRGLDPEPARRWPDFAALVSALGVASRSPTRRRAGIGVLVVGGGVAAAVSAFRAPPCPADPQIGAIWNDARAGEVRAAFVAVDPERGGGAADGVKAAMDDYVAQWRAAEHDNCVATQIEGTRTRRRSVAVQQCLGDATLEVGALVAALTDADARVVATAGNAVTWLQPVDRCAQAKASSATPAPPREARAEVEAIRTALRDAEATSAAGQHTDAQAAVQALRARADAVAYPPLIAAVAIARGRVAQRLGDYALAHDEYVEAYVAALTAGDRALASDAAFALAWAAQLSQSPADGLQWARHAEALLGPNPAPSAHRAKIELSRAAIHGRTGALDEALTFGTRAVAMLDVQLGAGHPSTLEARIWLAGIHCMRGDHRTCRDTIESVVSPLQRVLGRDNRRLAAVYEVLGGALLQSGEFEAAIEAEQRALSILDEYDAPDSAAHFAPTNAIGVAYTRLGREAESVAFFRRSAQIAEAAFGAEHPLHASGLLNLAELLARMESFDEAEPVVARACAVARKIDSDAGRNLQSRCHTQTAELALKRKESTRALEHAQRGYDLLEGIDAPNGQRGSALLALAAAMLASGGDRATAADHAEAARAIFERNAMHDELPRAEALLARLAP